MHMYNKGRFLEVLGYKNSYLTLTDLHVACPGRWCLQVVGSQRFLLLPFTYSDGETAQGVIVDGPQVPPMRKSSLNPPQASHTNRVHFNL